MGYKTGTDSHLKPSVWLYLNPRGTKRNQCPPHSISSLWPGDRCYLILNRGYFTQSFQFPGKYTGLPDQGPGASLEKSCKRNEDLPYMIKFWFPHQVSGFISNQYLIILKYIRHWTHSVVTNGNVTLLSKQNKCNLLCRWSISDLLLLIDSDYLQERLIE